jgi:hypothetical protein
MMKKQIQKWRSLTQLLWISARAARTNAVVPVKTVGQRVRSLSSLFLFALSLVACGDTGQQRVSYPIVARGIDAAPFQAGDWTVTLDDAQLLFGPVFFCASLIAAADLCPTAQAEFAAVSVVDLLDPNEQRIGEVNGLDGTINSLIFDYGVTWFVSEERPQLVSDALGEQSAIFSGTATHPDGRSLQFDASLLIAPTIRGGFAAQIGGTRVEIISDEVQLDVSFDVASWWSLIDFDVLAASGQTRITIAPGSTAHNSLLLSMTANETPLFSWSGAGAQ